MGSEKTLYVKMDSKGAHTSTMKLKQHTIEIVPDAPPLLFRLFSQGKSLAEVIEVHGELLKGRAFAGRDVDAPPYATVGTLTKITSLDGQFGGVDAATGAVGGLHAAWFSCAKYRSGFESVGQRHRGPDLPPQRVHRHLPECIFVTECLQATPPRVHLRHRMPAGDIFVTECLHAAHTPPALPTAGPGACLLLASHHHKDDVRAF